MSLLGRSNLISSSSCTCWSHDDSYVEDLTFSVDFGISLQCWVAPTGHTMILTRGVLLPQRKLKHKLKLTFLNFQRYDGQCS